MTRALADEEHALITTHVAETNFEIEQAAARYRMTDTEFLSDIGFLGPDVLAVHCVHCDRTTSACFAGMTPKSRTTPAAISISPRACRRSRRCCGRDHGRPRLRRPGQQQQPQPVSGDEVRRALIQKGVNQDATIMTAEKALEMATIDGARAVGLEDEIGSIEPGKKADIIVIDCETAFMTPVHHPVSAIVYSALGHETSSVMIDGRFVMRDGMVTSVDERTVRLDAQQRADDLARRSGADRFRKRAWRSI